MRLTYSGARFADGLLLEGLGIFGPTSINTILDIPQVLGLYLFNGKWLNIKCQGKFAILVLITMFKKVAQHQYLEFYSC